MKLEFCQLLFYVNIIRQLSGVLSSFDHGAIVQTSGSLAYWQDDSDEQVLGGDLSMSGNGRLQRPMLQFEPDQLDFGAQPLGMPQTRQVLITNRGPTVLQLLSISGSTRHLHCSFFQDKSVPAGGNTSFEVLFLAREEGSVKNTLSVHTSLGKVTYQVMGLGVPNPYRLHPLVGVKIPLNSTFTSLIHLYNPHSTSLQVEEVYSSGGDFHLELPTGETEASRDFWALSPFETKPIMRALFLGQREANHTAFIRIRTSGENSITSLVIPFEVEVSSAAGMFASMELLDFGLLRLFDEPKTLRLNLLNSGSEPIYISNITVQPHDPALSISFRPMYLKPNVQQSTTVAFVSYSAGGAEPSVNKGNVVVYARGLQPIYIPYVAQVLNGYLEYETNRTMFYTGDAQPQNVSRKIALTNVFNSSLVLFNITLSNDIRHVFTIENTMLPIVMLPHKHIVHVRLKFHPNVSRTHVQGSIYLHTNASVFTIPVHAYSGRLKVVHHRPEVFKGQLDFGTLAVLERRNMSFTVRNDNPIDVKVKRLMVNMENTVVELCGMEKGNGTMLTGQHNITSTANIDNLVLKPYHFAVFSVSLTAPADEGTYAAEVIFMTEYEDLYIPITLRTAEGSLTAVPDKVLIERCFPDKTSYRSLKIHSSFNQPMELRHVTFMPNDTRFYYIPPRETPVILEPHRDSYIGRLYFDPKRECGDDCYVGLPTYTSAGHHWLLGATLDRDVTDTDLYLFTRYQQKWLEYGFNQQAVTNVTIQLDTSQVRGFLFPAQAQLHWPLLARRNRLRFPLTHIGNYSVQDFIIENPADVPVIVQILPLALYPSPHTLLEILGSRVVFDPEDVIESTDADIFRIEDMTFSDSSSNGQLHPDLKRSIENTLGIRPHPLSVSAILPAGVKARVKVAFQPKQHLAQSSVIIIRNNLTIIEEVVVQGSGGLGELRFSNRRPGSPSPLLFQLTEKNLKSCDGAKKRPVRSIPPTFTVRRTFTLRNTGQLAFDLRGFQINEWPCEGYGFKVLECEEFTMEPNASRKIDIAFTPDFTMSRIRRELLLITSLGQPINFTLQATVPSYMLSRCAAALPRPSWEPALFYFIVCVIVFIVVCLLCTAYFEADRIFVADVCLQRSRQFERSGKIFDLKSIAGIKSPDGNRLVMPRSYSGGYVPPDYSNGHMYLSGHSGPLSTNAQYGIGDMSPQSQQSVYFLLRSSPNQTLPYPGTSSSSMVPSTQLVTSTSGTVGRTGESSNPTVQPAAVSTQPFVQNTSSMHQHRPVSPPVHRQNQVQASASSVDPTNQPVVQTATSSILTKVCNVASDLLSAFRRRSERKTDGAEGVSLPTLPPAIASVGRKVSAGSAAIAQNIPVNSLPVASVSSTPHSKVLTSQRPTVHTSPRATVSPMVQSTSAASPVTSTGAQPSKSEGQKRKSNDRAVSHASKMSATSTWLSSVTHNVIVSSSSSKKELATPSTADTKLEETRSSDKRPAKDRGSSLPREQSARLSKEFNDHDDSSSTTTESSNQDVEDKPVALTSTAVDEKPKQSGAASSVRDAKKSQKKSIESKSECATKEPRSVSKKSKADENLSDDIALSSLELPYLTELESRANKETYSTSASTDKPHKKRQRGSGRSKTSRVAGNVSRIPAPRMALYRSTSLHADGAISSSPPPAWDSTASTHSPELTDVTASSARGQAKVMSLSSDLKQQPVSSGVTGSRTDTISYSSVVSGRNSNSPAAGATGPARPASTDNNACVTTARASPSNSNPRLTLAEKKDPDGAVLGPGADMTMRELLTGQPQLRSQPIPLARAGPGHTDWLTGQSGENIPAGGPGVDIRFMNSSRDYMGATFGQHQQSTYMMPRSGDHMNNEGIQRDFRPYPHHGPAVAAFLSAHQHRQQMTFHGRADGMNVAPMHMPPVSANNWPYGVDNAAMVAGHMDNQPWAPGMMGGRNMSEMQWTRNADTMWSGGNIAFGQANPGWDTRGVGGHLTDVTTVASPVTADSPWLSPASSLWMPQQYVAGAASSPDFTNEYFNASLNLPPDDKPVEPAAFYTASMTDDGELVDSSLPPYDPLGRSIWSASETAGMNGSGSGWLFTKGQSRESDSQ